MGTFIFIVIVLFFVSAVVAFVINKRKEKEYEKDLPEAVLKSKKTYEGSLNSYVNDQEEKTILRYFISKQTYTIENFIPTNEILIKYCLVLFDEQRERLSIVQDVTTPGAIITIPFSDVISLQPIEVSKSRKVTEGGISPITICGYRWISVRTKNLKEVSKISIKLRYKSGHQESSVDINVFSGITNEKMWRYESIVEEVNAFINEFNKIVAR